MLQAYSWRLRSGALEAYVKRHQEVWPGLVDVFGEAGVRTFSIYASDEQVFMHSEVSDEGSWRRAWATEVHKRWGELMRPLIVVGADNAPLVQPLRTVYHLGTSPQEGI